MNRFWTKTTTQNPLLLLATIDIQQNSIFFYFCYLAIVNCIHIVDIYIYRLYKIETISDNTLLFSAHVLTRLDSPVKLLEEANIYY